MRSTLVDNFVHEDQMEKFVSYLRVSTDRQGKSGLGLEAQRHQVEQHLNSVGGDLVSELVEVESGKRNNRPKLHEAIALSSPLYSPLDFWFL